jgi:peptidoglycan/LPS O-acetylase OafA/YrhL
MWSLAVALVIAVAVYVCRRFTERRAAWLWPMLAAVGGGLLIGMIAVLVTHMFWTFAATYVVVAVVVAVLTTRFSAQPAVADEGEHSDAQT